MGVSQNGLTLREVWVMTAGALQLFYRLICMVVTWVSVYVKN